MSLMWRIIKGPVYSMSRGCRTRESRPALKYFTAIYALLNMPHRNSGRSDDLSAIPRSVSSFRVEVWTLGRPASQSGAG